MSPGDTVHVFAYWVSVWRVPEDVRHRRAWAEMRPRTVAIVVAVRTFACVELALVLWDCRVGWIRASDVVAF